MKNNKMEVIFCDLTKRIISIKGIESVYDLQYMKDECLSDIKKIEKSYDEYTDDYTMELVEEIKTELSKGTFYIKDTTPLFDELKPELMTGEFSLGYIKDILSEVSEVNNFTMVQDLIYTTYFQ